MTVEHERFLRYFPPSDQDEHWGLYVTGAGCEPFEAGQPFSCAGHPAMYRYRWNDGRVLPEFAIAYIAQGGGIHENCSGTHKLCAGSVYFHFPGVWHRARHARETGMVEYWVNANGDYLLRLMHHGLLSPREPVLELEVESSAEVLQAFARLLGRIRDNPPALHRLLAAHVMEILAVVSAGARPAPPLVSGARTSDDPLVAAALRLIWNYSEPRTLRVHHVAGKLAVTRRTLERRFQRSLRRTVFDEIAQCRMERAKRLLEETNLPIKHVAAAAGFSNVDRMFEAFRRMEGVSPGAYREGHQAAVRSPLENNNGE